MSFFINFDSFLNDDGLNIDVSDTNVNNVSSRTTITPEKKKKGRPKKNEGVVALTKEDREDFDKPMSQVQSNVPYINTYNDTTNMLMGVITEIDCLNRNIGEELMKIRGAKNLKSRYQNISDLTSTSASLLNNKVSAIKEINSTISKSHDLDLKRVKEVNSSKVDDDKQIMDMYNAYISTPVGIYNPPNAVQYPSNMSTYIMQPEFDQQNIIPMGGNNDAGYQAYVRNLTPEQNMMRYEKNPNVKIVVIFDRNTGSRKFEVMDLSTNTPIPNTPVPNDIVLDNLDISLANSIARDVNTGQSFPVVAIDTSAGMENY